ncbi:MAG: aldolase/citrate lyase family protein, partial [Verrucomicrobiota bacterium]
GVRGVGAERATCWGECFVEHAGEADENVLVVPLIESVKAGENIDSLLRVEGADLFFFGPADYSATAGFTGQWEGPGVAEKILAAKDRILAAGKYAGVIARSDEDLKLRTEQGFQALGLGLDAGLMIRSLKNSLKSIGRGGRIISSLSIPAGHDFVAASQRSPLTTLPEEFRPTLPEVMNPVGSGKQATLEHGVSFECLVGAHNHARELTTGIVTFAPGAKLPYHVHAFGESVTVLNGSLIMDAQGRRYHLGAMDNITIPRGIPHSAINVSKQPVRVHVAMATSSPSRDLVEAPASMRSIPEDASGFPGREHVVRFGTARRYEAGPNTQFIDHLNSELVPGIEMSGGYGLFFKGGRLPAHLHDFDESICIVQGSATCNVEGRLYTMADFSTALQPRGRVHYFINENEEAMAMLWVYAGPMPERIMVDEHFTRPGAGPWK